MDVISNINNLNIYNTDSNTLSKGSLDVAVESTAKIENSNNQDEKEKYTKKDLDDAIEKVNNFLKDEKTHAEYSVHKDFGTLMIKIVDDQNNKVIMELPPEKILDMIASMCKQFGLLDKKA